MKFLNDENLTLFYRKLCAVFPVKRVITFYELVPYFDADKKIIN